LRDNATPAWRRVCLHRQGPLVVLLLCALAPACTKDAPATGEGAQPASDDAPSPNELPPLTLRDDTPDLLLTWIDDKGDFHVVPKPSDVPEAGRKQVR